MDLYVVNLKTTIRNSNGVTTKNKVAVCQDYSEAMKCAAKEVVRILYEAKKDKLAAKFKEKDAQVGICFDLTRNDGCIQCIKDFEDGIVYTITYDGNFVTVKQTVNEADEVYLNPAIDKAKIAAEFQVMIDGHSWSQEQAVSKEAKSVIFHMVEFVAEAVKKFGGDYHRFVGKAWNNTLFRKALSCATLDFDDEWVLKYSPGVEVKLSDGTVVTGNIICDEGNILIMDAWDIMETATAKGLIEDVKQTGFAGYSRIWKKDVSKVEDVENMKN